MFNTLPSRPPARSFSLSARSRALSVILADEFGAPFRLYDAESGQELGLPTMPQPLTGLDRLSAAEVVSLAQSGKCRVMPAAADGTYQLCAVLFDAARPLLVGVARLRSATGVPSPTEQDRLQRWLQAVSDRIRLTEQAAEVRLGESEQAAGAKRAWGVVLGIDEAIRRLKVHKGGNRPRASLLQAIVTLLDCQAAAWVPESKDETALAQGLALLSQADYVLLGKLLARAAAVSPPGRPVVWNQDQSKLWRDLFPGVHNLVAVPIREGNPNAWLVALNKTQGSEREREPGQFRRSDAAALTPFASLLDLQWRGSARFQELKGLLVGLTRSLTAAIDAKDAYTFGHSERVARIAREVGRQLNLPEEELSDIYLAGLLHDVGKIGIRDAVLTKGTELTDAEFDHMKEHPVIGHRILSDIGPLRALLPGVRSHHERFDGKGYPDGLKGDDIPLIARILAVADAFDAMSTTRPYRALLGPEEALNRLRFGAGTQWDPKLVEAILRCREEVFLIRERGLGESLTSALDGVLRGHRGSSHCYPVE
jgi:HD-GYP domain-containing protein (c-di-GMP phosphodiesterase class II)